MEGRHERPGSRGYYSLMTRTDARACRAIIPDPAALAHLTHTNPLELQDTEAHLLAYLATVPDPRAAGKPLERLLYETPWASSLCRRPILTVCTHAQFHSHSQTPTRDLQAVA
jgi:hypothetical protein